MSDQSLVLDFKQAMQELAASVNIITTCHDESRNGLTATAVCSLSMEPASMLVCIHQDVQALEEIRASGFFCINVLSAEQQEVSDVFAGRSGARGEQRFQEAGNWTASQSGAPMLDGALANVVCELQEINESGTHHICIGHVREVRLNQGSTPLIYAQQQYGTLADLPEAEKAA
ncbi:flavin reductase family protein [Endozoicomonas arenosclerae]|uniref:flavin reductase family protein n=1 Tax=Endozoicomonas arenosclerae TaxID=1633495 RepID=UPI000783EA8F|nr:flavin reductase family protein [Endozoicomonas arenosclerae]